MSFIVQPVTPPSIFKIAEKLAAGAGGNIDFFVGYYDTLIYTGNASASTVLNITNQTGSTLNEIMAAGDQLNIQFQITNASPAYAIQYIQIDSGAAAVEISLADNLTGFTAYPDSITVYNLEIVKNSDNDFTVLAGYDETSTTQNIPNPPSNPSATFVTAGIQIAFDASISGDAALGFNLISDPSQYTGTNSASPILIEPPFVSGAFDIQVAAYNAAGISDYSSATTITLTGPTEPTGVSAALSGSDIVVTFTEASGSWEGLAIDYIVRSTPSSSIFTGSGSPVVITSGVPIGDIYTFTVQAQNYVGLSTVSDPSNSLDLNIKADYLVVAGGGGGGSSRGGGGGAGGYREFSQQTFVGNTNYLVTIGAGGPNITPGSDSTFDTITSAGGGRGGHSSGANATGGNGGSGGGARGLVGAVGGTGNTPVTTPSQGNNGGNASATSGYAGGGGGASQVGAPGVGTVSGAGGNGTASSITGSSVTRAGGGGGGNWGSAIALGGTGGGGNGGTGNQVVPPSINPTPGGVNTGGGGGGGQDNTNGAAGGSGIVIVRYGTVFGTLTVGAGLTYSQTTDGSDYVYEFTAGSDNISWS